MALLISYEAAWKRIERMEAAMEAAMVELPEIPDGDTLRGRATRLINTGNLPNGDDLDFCYSLLNGNIVAG